MDHKAEFKLLVLERYDKKLANVIEWSSPRLLCIAGDFTKYDEHAVQQINRNIELIRYKKYGEELLLLELVNATTAQPVIPPDKKYKTVTDYYDQADTKLKDLYEALEAFLLALGDDVQKKTLQYYIAFKRIKNFATVEIHTKTRKLLVCVKGDPDKVDLKANKGFLRDMRKIGHLGTGDLEITIDSLDAFEKAIPYLIQSYEAS